MYLAKFKEKELGEQEEENLLLYRSVYWVTCINYQTNRYVNKWQFPIYDQLRSN